MDLQDTGAPDGDAEDRPDMPSPSSASFWDRSTWDPNTLGAVAFGQPTPPYRSPGQVMVDAMDALITGPSHPGWSEPATRTAIDNLTSAMPLGAPRGLLDEGMQVLADQGHPQFQAWAANRDALNNGAHPLSGLWAMNTRSNPTSGPVRSDAPYGEQQDEPDNLPSNADPDDASNVASPFDTEPGSSSAPPVQIAKNDLTDPGTMPTAPTPSYDIKDSSVIIPSDLQSSVEAIGKGFTAQTGKRMTVTSGYRDAQSQAAAMYGKFHHDNGSDYTNKAALKDIHDAYANGQAAGLPQAEIVENMRQEIQKQIDGGVHISDHTVGNGQAIDIRTRDLSPKEQAALRTAIENNVGLIHPEPGNPHFHVKLLGLRGRQ